MTRHAAVVGPDRGCGVGTQIAEPLETNYDELAQKLETKSPLEIMDQVLFQCGGTPKTTPARGRRKIHHATFVLAKLPPWALPLTLPFLQARSDVEMQRITGTSRLQGAAAAVVITSRIECSDCTNLTAVTCALTAGR